MDIIVPNLATLKLLVYSLAGLPDVVDYRLHHGIDGGHSGMGAFGVLPRVRVAVE